MIEMCDLDHFGSHTAATSISQTCSEVSERLNADLQLTSSKRNIKSVHFNERVDIILIPSRDEVLQLNLSICMANMFSKFASCLKTENMQKLTETHRLKHVTFTRIVTMFKIPNRRHYKKLFSLLWYHETEINAML